MADANKNIRSGVLRDALAEKSILKAINKRHGSFALTRHMSCKNKNASVLVDQADPSKVPENFLDRCLEGQGGPQPSPPCVLPRSHMSISPTLSTTLFMCAIAHHC